MSFETPKPSFLSGMIKRRVSAAAEDHLALRMSPPIEGLHRRLRSSSMSRSRVPLSMSPCPSCENATVTPEVVAWANAELARFASDTPNPTAAQCLNAPSVQIEALQRWMDEAGITKHLVLATLSGPSRDAQPVLGSPVEVVVCSVNDQIYLPSNIASSSTYNDEDPEPAGSDPPETLIDHDSEDAVERCILGFDSPLHLSSCVESDLPIVHMLLVVVNVVEPIVVGPLSVQFTTAAMTVWPKGVPTQPNRALAYSRLGVCQWKLEFSQCDQFIARDGTSRGLDQLRPFMKYRMFATKDVGRDEAVTTVPAENTFADPNPQGLREVVPGLYVFLIPMLLPPTLPETIHTKAGSLIHELSTLLRTGSAKTYHSRCQVAAIKLAPSQSNTTANKPVYVNKTWNDALNYEISFPHKYLSLSRPTAVQIKLIPLEKHLVVKRVRVNITEKVTCFFDAVPTPKQRLKDRVVCLYEVRTTDQRTSPRTPKKQRCPALRETVVKCYNDNLLLRSFRVEKPPKPESTNSMVVVEAILVDVPLLLDAEAALPTLDAPLSDSSRTPERRGLKRILHRRLDLGTSSETAPPKNKMDYILCPDSNTKLFKVSHRIQVSFRISRLQRLPNPEWLASLPASANVPQWLEKYHHYEVMIDSAILLLSKDCPDQQSELPLYQELARTPGLKRASSDSAEALISRFDPEGGSCGSVNEDLPTFEEAVYSVPNTPYGSPLDLSRLSSWGSRQASRRGSAASFNNLDGIMNRFGDTCVTEGSSLKQSLYESFSRSRATPPPDAALDSESDGENHPPSYAELAPLMSDLEDDTEADTNLEARPPVLRFSSNVTMDEQGIPIDLVEDSRRRGGLRPTDLYRSYH